MIRRGCGIAKCTGRAPSIVMPGSIRPTDSRRSSRARACQPGVRRCVFRCQRRKSGHLHRLGRRDHAQRIRSKPRECAQLHRHPRERELERRERGLGRRSTTAGPRRLSHGTFPGARASCGCAEADCPDKCGAPARLSAGNRPSDHLADIGFGEVFSDEQERLPGEFRKRV